jgi:hypothetical protein
MGAAIQAIATIANIFLLKLIISPDLGIIFKDSQAVPDLVCQIFRTMPRDQGLPEFDVSQILENG